MEDFQSAEAQRESALLAQLFEEHGQLRSCKKNEYIFREEDNSDEIYYVRSGLVKISQSAQEGQSITLFLRHVGEVFGAAEVLIGEKRQRDARCIVSSEVLTIAAPVFKNLLQSRTDVLYALTLSNARRLLQTQRYVEMLISRPAAWRLAHFLLQLGRRKGSTLQIALQLSHEEISFIVGCSRQTVTETLNKWREQGLISYEKKSVFIHDSAQFLSGV
ncbi:Crp/Fnr family transcriptional regulator [Paenibacillus sepulcri]|uniref:Crp/Fnr family transcriptional regulator n=1 Tax=Paenibacillus sepulcri TaxID=359917 RepID=UPI001AE52FAF